MRITGQCLKGLIVIGLLWPVSSSAFLGNEDAATGSHEPTRLIVKFTPETKLNLTQSRGMAATGVAEVDELHQRYAVSRQQALMEDKQIRTADNPLRGVYILQVEAGTDIEAMAEEYSRLNAVQYAEPDYLMQLHDVPDDPLLAQQWALNNTAQGHYHVDRIAGDFNDTIAVVYGVADADIDASEVFDNPPDNTNTVVVAIIDTGFDYIHPDLVGMAWSNPGEIPDNGIDDDHNGFIDDAVGWDFCGNPDVYPIWGDNDPTDPMGHGTHCAGIVASVINNATGVCGVVPEARIMSLKCYPLLLFSLVAKSLVYATDNGADVISMSFGGWFPSDIVRDALKYARAHDVVPMASAGNGGCNCGAFPAIYPEVFCVSASNDSDHIALWSSYGDSTDICAPGQSILSLRAAGTDMYESHEPDVHVIDEYYYLSSGTSMSCPYAAAVAAYLRAASPGLTASKTLETIASTADDIVDPYGMGLSYPGWDMFSGHGRVNLAAALAARPLVRAAIDSPVGHAIVSGSIDIIGSADGPEFSPYVLEYGAGDLPQTWITIHSASSPVTEGLLGIWNTSSLQGRYTVRLRVGAFNLATIRLYLVNSTVAEIHQPIDTDTSSGLVDVVVTAACADFSHILVDCGPGIEPTAWDTVDIVSRPADSESVCSWQAGTLNDGLYTLRITVFSDVGPQASDEVQVSVFSPFSGETGWKVALDTVLGRVPNYGDFDNDGLNEIVVGTATGVRFFNVDGTEKTSGVPLFPPDDYQINVAVGELDGDGVDDIVAIGFEAATLHGFPSSAPAFSIALEVAPGKRIIDNRLYLKDIDNDGLDEIHYAPAFYGPGFSAYYFLYRPDGSAWGHDFPLDDDYVSCFPADLDSDLIDEIYCYNDTSHYLVHFDTTGQAVDSTILEINGLPPVIAFISMSAVDIDNDDRHELIVMGFSDPTGNPFYYSDFFVYAFDQGLELMEGWPHDIGYTGYAMVTPPIFCDLDNDGLLEYICTISDGNFSRVHVWRIDGTSFLGENAVNGIFASPPNPSTLHYPIAIDADGDCSLDIMVNASRDLWQTYTAERVVCFNSRAEMLNGFPILVDSELPGQLFLQQTPTYGDIDKDGVVDLVVSFDNELLFANLYGHSYNLNFAPCPMRFYNRRLNFTAPLASEFTVVCGDMNGSGGVANISDITFYVDYMFAYGPTPPYPDMADVDGSGRLDISDLTYMVDFMFGGGPPPNCP